MRALDSTERGDWLLARAGAWATVGGVAGDGFDAYARILHPLQAWHGDDVEETARWCWAEVARRNGRTMHPLVQWNSLTDFEKRLEFDDGWRVGQSEEGQLAVDLLAALAEHLGRATRSPDETTAAIWNGWGELHPDSMGIIVLLSDDTLESDRAHLEAEARKRKLDEMRATVTSEVAAIVDSGPLFAWPGREMLLLQTSLAELSDLDWPEAGGVAGVMPQMLWPADRSWVVASEIDWDSTIVAGSRALIDAVLADERFESFEVQAVSDLSWDGDTVNPRPRERMDP